MSKNTKGSFRVIKKTRFKDLLNEAEVSLPESDLAFQNEEGIVQFEYVKPEEEPKYIIKPGIFTMTPTSSSIALHKIELRLKPMLDSIDNTTKIINEARLFFSSLDIYEELNQPKNRKLLLYSPPGMGKSAAISKACRDFLAEDAGTVIMMWPTSSVEADNVANFFSAGSEYDESCTRLILIMEDIGGGETENRVGAVDAALLNLLDGTTVNFSLPTFIIATTNHPENLLESLADRPQRFDLMIKLEAPSTKERLELVAFIAKRALSEDEKEALSDDKCDDFSIAHLVETVIRSRLHRKTIATVVNELVAHSKLFDKGFNEKKGKLGL